MSQFILPSRIGNAPIIYAKPPQIQLSDKSPDNIKQALKEWAFTNIPKTKECDSLISVVSTRAMWLDENHQQAHEDAFMLPTKSREYCHLHKDGSIHAIVADMVKKEILIKKWGLKYPWHWKGAKEVLVYAARNKDELKILKNIIIKSYQYASGDVDSKISL